MKLTMRQICWIAVSTVLLFSHHYRPVKCEEGWDISNPSNAGNDYPTESSDSSGMNHEAGFEQSNSGESQRHENAVTEPSSAQMDSITEDPMHGEGGHSHQVEQGGVEQATYYNESPSDFGFTDGSTVSSDHRNDGPDQQVPNTTQATAHSERSEGYDSAVSPDSTSTDNSVDEQTSWTSRSPENTWGPDTSDTPGSSTSGDDVWRNEPPGTQQDGVSESPTDFDDPQYVGQSPPPDYDTVTLGTDYGEIPEDEPDKAGEELVAACKAQSNYQGDFQDPSESSEELKCFYACALVKMDVMNESSGEMQLNIQTTMNMIEDAFGEDVNMIEKYKNAVTTCDQEDGGSGNDDRINDTGVEDDDQQLVDFFKFLEIPIDLFH